MIKNIIITFVILTFFPACNSNNAYTYSEEFVASENSLIPNIEITETKVETFIENEQFDSVAVASEKMENQIDSIIGEIKIKPAPNGKLGEKFKVDVLKYFEYFKSIYASYKNYGNAKTDKNRIEEAVKMQTIISTKDAVVKKIQQSQREFAEANGFKLQK
jgi:hypothetical protein